MASFLNINNLPKEQFVVDTKKDNNFTTKNGTKIIINAGSIQAATDTVRLDWKEAVGMQQIVLAGLGTATTDSKPLSSAGMFYLAATADKTAKVVQPIQVNLPTNTVNDSMKLFAAKEINGDLQWEKPISFKVKKPLAIVAKGKALFSANCASCHAIYKDATGPALYNIRKIRSRDYLQAFTNNWRLLVEAGDCQAIIAQNWSSSAMNKFNFKPEEIDAIYDYIETNSDSAKVMSFTLEQSTLIAQKDSCTKYKLNAYKLSELTKKRDDLPNKPLVRINNKNDVDTTNVGDTAVADLSDLSNLVTTVEPTSENYEIGINDFGWFNIDILTDSMPNVKEVDVKVPILTEYEDYLKVMLIVPDSKIMVTAHLKNGNYVFGEKSAQLKLPTNQRSFILAIGEKEGKLVYSLVPFVPVAENKLVLNIKTTTPYSFNETMRRLGWTGLDIKAAESKMAGKMQELDYQIQQIEQYRPSQYCDCEPIMPTDGPVGTK